jgi:uncharacterized protein HemX
MDALEYLSRNWEVVASAPVAFLVALGLGGVAGYWLAMGHFKGAAAAKSALAEATRERLEATQEDLARLQARDSAARQEIGYLVGRLTSHGEAIDQIRNEVDQLPRIIVSDRPPGPDDTAPEGSMWALVDKKEDGEKSRPEANG